VTITGGYQPAIGRSIGANQVFSLAPIANRGIEIALAPLPEYTRATNLYAPYSSPAQSQGTDLSFPVAGVNPITSAFGWRIHPISGQGRMHDGTDIGAPLGTPVVAAYPGTVAAAQWSGGYGLMVTLRHLDGTQESRYAHLSEMFVEPGQTVAQGEMIGRVGSTGFSTGPHLHFEWRHLTNDGWVAVDAGPHLQFALANLMRAQNYAQANADSQS
jgi:murein DD-endopeptidase MepM/ murein hydrolase activator NlpD